MVGIDTPKYRAISRVEYGRTDSAAATRSTKVGALASVCSRSFDIMAILTSMAIWYWPNRKVDTILAISRAPRGLFDRCPTIEAGLPILVGEVRAFGMDETSVYTHRDYGLVMRPDRHGAARSNTDR